MRGTGAIKRASCNQKGPDYGYRALSCLTGPLIPLTGPPFPLQALRSPYGVPFNRSIVGHRTPPPSRLILRDARGAKGPQCRKPGRNTCGLFLARVFPGLKARFPLRGRRWIPGGRSLGIPQTASKMSIGLCLLSCPVSLSSFVAQALTRAHTQRTWSKTTITLALGTQQAGHATTLHSKQGHATTLFFKECLEGSEKRCFWKVLRAQTLRHFWTYGLQPCGFPENDGNHKMTKTIQTATKQGLSARPRTWRKPLESGVQSIGSLKNGLGLENKENVTLCREAQLQYRAVVDPIFAMLCVPVPTPITHERVYGYSSILVARFDSSLFGDLQDLIPLKEYPNFNDIRVTGYYKSRTTQTYKAKPYIRKLHARLENTTPFPNGYQSSPQIQRWQV